MPTEEDCFHRQQGHSFEPAKRSWSPSHGFKRKCKSKSVRTKSTSLQGRRSPRPYGQRKSERYHLLGRTIKYNSTTGSGVCRCCLKGNRQRSSSGRRSGFAPKFLANSFKSQSRHSRDRVTPAIEPVTPQQTASPSDACQHAAPFQDIPAHYVKDIQSGEFFELSKLLLKNLSELNEDDNLVLTLDNSVVRVSKKAKTSISITEIEQWTTAFTTYMSVFTQKFPQRSQELLQYLSLISLVYFRLFF